MRRHGWESWPDWGQYFDVPEDQAVERRAARVRDKLQELDWPALLIVDGITTKADLDWLPKVGPCRILATTRDPYLVHHHFETLSLPLLDEGAALTILQSGCPVEATAAWRIREEPGYSLEMALRREKEAAQGIADHLGYLPLALILIASYIEQRKVTFAECWQRLKTNTRPLRPNGEYNLNDAISISHDVLSAPALAALSTAACFAARGISPVLLFEASGLADRDNFEEALAELERGSLLSRESDNRISLHELVRVFAQEQIDDAERPMILQRVAETLTRRLRQANEAMEWAAVRRELPHCRAAVEFCSVHLPAAPLALLLDEMGLYHYCHEETRQALWRYNAALEWLEKLPEPNLRVVARVKRHLCEAADPREPEAQKEARRALSYARAVLLPGDPEIAEFYTVVGLVLKMRGKLACALPFYHKALQICEEFYGRESAQVAECLNNLGTLYERRGDYPTDLAYLEESGAILQKVRGEGHRQVAIVLNNLGRVQVKLGAIQEALHSHQRARTIYATLFGSKNKDVAMSLFFYGEALHAAGKTEEACQSGREALAILEHLYGEDDEQCQRVRDRLQTRCKEEGGRRAS